MLDLGSHPDQAATLRRLFAAPTARLLPVLMPEFHCTLRSAWITKLAQGFARNGERTLVIDAARAQVAAALGLRARYDLLHALRGECAFDAAVLDAGRGLAVLPAARALGALADPRALLARTAALAARPQPADLLLYLLPPAAFAACAAGHDGDLLVPLPPAQADLVRTLADLQRAVAQRADTARFRLLFLGMDDGPASTLASRIEARLDRGGTPPAVARAGAAQVARDLAPVVRGAAGWPLARIALAG